jgi:hypothetical protein
MIWPRIGRTEVAMAMAFNFEPAISGVEALGDGRAGRAGAAAGASVLAFPEPIGMVLTYPAAALAKRAFH